MAYSLNATDADFYKKMKNNITKSIDFYNNFCYNKIIIFINGGIR